MLDPMCGYQARSNNNGRELTVDYVSSGDCYSSQDLKALINIFRCKGREYGVVEHLDCTDTIDGCGVACAEYLRSSG